MKWGYKYENGDIVLNEKSLGEELAMQGLFIWKSQTREEYYSDFGFDRNFFLMEEELQKKEIIRKIGKDLVLPAETTIEYNFDKNKEILNIKLNFKNNA